MSTANLEVELSMLDGIAPPDADAAVFDTDPAAPHGRTLSGDPKRGPGGRPPRTRRARTSSSGSAGSRTPKPPGKTRGPGGKSSGPAARYADGAAGLLQGVGTMLAGVAMATQRQEFLADAAAIADAAPGLSTAVGQLAVDMPAVGAVLDRLGQVGPYGALIGALVPLVAQLAANHGVTAAQLVPGVQDPGALVAAQLARFNAAAAAHMAEAAPADDDRS